MKKLLPYFILIAALGLMAPASAEAKPLPFKRLSAFFKASEKRDTSIFSGRSARMQDTSLARERKKIKEVAKPRPQVKPERVERPPVISRPPVSIPGSGQQPRPGGQRGGDDNRPAGQGNGGRSQGAPPGGRGR